MGYLIIPLGAHELEDGETVALERAYYRDDHPGGLYGNALIIPCEYQPDTEG